jgi:hypothetical protein
MGLHSGIIPLAMYILRYLICFLYLYSGCFGGYNSPIVTVVFGGADFGCFSQLHFTSVLLALLYLKNTKCSIIINKIHVSYCLLVMPCDEVIKSKHGRKIPGSTWTESGASVYCCCKSDTQPHY